MKLRYLYTLKSLKDGSLREVEGTKRVAVGQHLVSAVGEHFEVVRRERRGLHN